MITLNITLSKEDYLNYSYYVYWGQPGNKFRIIQKKLLQFTVYTGLLAVLINYDKQGNVDLRYIIPFILILASIFILPLFAVKRSLAKQVSLLYNNELNNSLFSECIVTFSETGFTSMNDAGELSRKWKAVVKSRKQKLLFFIYLHHAGHCYPKKDL